MPLAGLLSFAAQEWEGVGWQQLWGCEALTASDDGLCSLPCRFALLQAAPMDPFAAMATGQDPFAAAPAAAAAPAQDPFDFSSSAAAAAPAAAAAAVDPFAALSAPVKPARAPPPPPPPGAHLTPEALLDDLTRAPKAGGGPKPGVPMKSGASYSANNPFAAAAAAPVPSSQQQQPAAQAGGGDDWDMFFKDRDAAAAQQ